MPNEADRIEPGSTASDPVRGARQDLAFLWTAVAVVGAIAIKWYQPPDSLWLRMVPPLFLMVAYVGFALSWQRGSRQRIADSVYFLGFLWTLWALICALLWESGLGSPDGVLTTQDLLYSFGYALITTAAGMFGRLLILQFYRTVDDQETEAVVAADEAVDRTLQALTKLEQGIAKSQHAFVTLFEEFWQERRETARHAIDESIGDNQAATDQAAAGLQSALSSLEANVVLIAEASEATAHAIDAHRIRIEDALNPLEQGATTLAQAIDGTADGVQALADQIQSTGGATAMLNTSIASSRLEVEALAARLRAISLSKEEIKQVIDLHGQAAVKVVSKGVDRLGDRMQEVMEESTQSTGTALYKLREAIAAVQQEARALVKRVAQLRAEGRSAGRPLF